MTENELIQEPRHIHIPGTKTTIQLEKETLALLNECEGIEAQRRGGSWMKHDVFILFVCRLYKQNKKLDECKTALYLARKEEMK